MRRTLNRVHVWPGWLVGVPLLLSTASGLRMVAICTDVSAAAHLTGEPT